MATKRVSLGSHPLYGFNFLTKFSKRTELISYLRDLHAHLATLDQDVQNAPRGMSATISHLINPKILENPDKEIRVLTACCIVDTLRIYAPEAPYKDADMIRVYTVLISQIRGLQNVVDSKSDIGEKIIYILSSLATVKSCVVPVIMSQSNVPGASDLVETMFETVVNTVRPEHNDEILMYFSEILHFCIEEYEGISEALLDILLQPLLPSAKNENPTAFKVVAVVLRAVASLIRKTVTEVIHDILLGSTSKLHGKLPEIAEDIYPVIYELHRISPIYLIDIVPLICLQLKVEEVDIRRNAVKLLCSLFASEPGVYVKDFQRDLKEFLGRLNDLSVDIRAEVLDCCGVILNSNVDCTIVEEMVAKRLRDPDEGIRLTALKQLLEYAHNHIETVSMNTISEISDRAKDKKFEIRKLALEGLSKLYHKYFSSKLSPLYAAHLRVEMSLAETLTIGIPPSVKMRLSGIPGIVIKSWGFPDIASRHLCVQLVQEYLLPKRKQKEIKSLNSDLLIGKYCEEDDTSSTSHDRSCQNESSEDVFKDYSERHKTCNAKNRNLNDPENNIQTGNEGNELLSQLRCAALVMMYISFDDSDKSCFSSMLAFKAKVYEELNRFLNIKLTNGNQTVRLSDVAFKNDHQPSIIFQMKQALQMLTLQLPLKESSRRTANTMNAGNSTLFEKLLSTKDRTVYRLIGNCLSGEDDIEQALANRDDLQRRLDSKSALGEYFGMVYDFAGHMVCNKKMMIHLLEVESLAMERVSSDDLIKISEIIFSTIRFAPRLASLCSSHFLQWLDQLQPTVIHNSRSRKSKLATAPKILNPDQFLLLYNTLICCGRYLEEDHSKEQLGAKIINLLDSVDDVDQCYRLAELLSHLAFCCSVRQEESPDLANNMTSPPSPTLASTIAYINRTCSKAALYASGNLRIINQLQALIALSSIPQNMYESFSQLYCCSSRILQAFDPILKTELFQFIQQGIFGNPGNSPEWSGSDLQIINIKANALKLWTNIVCCDSENYFFRKDTDRLELGSDIFRAHPSGRPDIKAVISTVFDCLVAHGGELGGFKIASKEYQQVLYFAAAWCGLQLMRTRSFGDKITPLQWQELGWAFVNIDDRAMKKQLVGVLVSLLQTHPVHIKFLTYPCLLASDPNDQIAEYAQRGLVFAIRRLRKTQEEVGTKVIEEVNEKRREKYQKTATFTMPEMILPYLLHLLSYSPEFPRSVGLESEEDRRRMKSVVRCINCVLTALQSTLRVETSNLPYLFKQLNTINRSYVDRLDPENIGLHVAVRLAVKLLHEHVKTADNLQIHPGEIILPPDLFSLEVDGNQDRGKLEGLEVAENAMNKLLHINKGKVGNKPLLSSPLTKRTRSPIGSEERRSSFAAIEGEDQQPERKFLKLHNTKVVTLEANAPTRVMPKRSAKASAPNYAEKDEVEIEFDGDSETAERLISTTAIRKSLIHGSTDGTENSSVLTTRKLSLETNPNDKKAQETKKGLRTRPLNL